MKRSFVTKGSLAGIALGLLACSVGRGEGQVESDDLSVPGCFDGRYRMNPNYFSSSPYEDSQTLRIQRGDSPQQNTDSLVIIIHETSTIVGRGSRPSRLGTPIDVRLPSESLPENVPARFDEAPLVTMSLHLGETCEEEVVSLQAISGTITFFELFDGSPNSKKSDRLIDAEFDVVMGDARDVVPDENSESGYAAPEGSRVTGAFQFHYRRGQPAQTFP